MSLLWWLKKNAYKVGVLTIFLYNLFVIYNRKCFQEKKEERSGC